MDTINSQFESDIQSNLPSSEFVGSNPTLPTNTEVERQWCCLSKPKGRRKVSSCGPQGIETSIPR